MRLLMWFVALAALVLGTWIIWGGGWSDRFTFAGSVSWLENTGPWAWAAGMLLLVGDIVLPVPGTIVISALGFLYGTIIGGLIATAGLMAAGITGYGLGRICGEGFARRWLGDADYEKGHRMFSNGGAWVVALSRAVPILPEVISCTAGLVRMPFRRFVMALACGSVPMGFLFAAIGGAGHDAPTWAFGLSILLPALLWWVASHIHR